MSVLSTIASAGLALITVLCVYATVTSNFSLLDPCRLAPHPLLPSECYEIIKAGIDEADSDPHAASEMMFMFTLAARVEAATYTTIGITAACALPYLNAYMRSLSGLTKASRREFLPKHPRTTRAVAFLQYLLEPDCRDQRKPPQAVRVRLQ